MRLRPVVKPLGEAQDNPSRPTEGQYVVAENNTGNKATPHEYYVPAHDASWPSATCFARRRRVAHINNQQPLIKPNAKSSSEFTTDDV
ncbi:hypothetical protein E2C01_037838 [Portunus trituberculatus]|uniref:Uncharacterized protein n=1 Tax=Portunus trituberculatus TaxID=210409 RepID=A0A5B7FIA0_PORTR|nr:hypothetical protein [Portunus trituberculatus]